jgi:hypothetical protein
VTPLSELKVTTVRDVEQCARRRLADFGPNIGLPQGSEYIVHAAMEMMNVSEPEYDSGESSKGLVTGYITEPNEVLGQAKISGGICLKPGNIQLDLGRLLRLGPPVLKTIHEKTLASILLLASALAEIALSVKRNLSVNQVIVFRAMWELGGELRGLPEAEILRRANQDLESQGSASLGESDLQTTLMILSELKCIETDAAEPRSWKVVEEINYKYQ